MIIIYTQSLKQVFRGRHLALALRVASMFEAYGIPVFMQVQEDARQ